MTGNTPDVPEAEPRDGLHDYRQRRRIPGSQKGRPSTSVPAGGPALLQRHPLPGGGHLDMDMEGGGGRYRAEPISARAWEACLELHAVSALHGLQVADGRALAEQAVEALAQLAPRSQQVLAMRAQGASLEEIGQGLNVTRERVRQIERQSIRQLFTPDLGARPVPGAPGLMRTVPGIGELRYTLGQLLSATGGTAALDLGPADPQAPGASDPAHERALHTALHVMQLTHNWAAPGSARPEVSAWVRQVRGTPLYWRWAGPGELLPAQSGLQASLELRAHERHAEQGLYEGERRLLIVSRTSGLEALELSRALADFQVCLSADGEIVTPLDPELIRQIEAWDPLNPGRSARPLLRRGGSRGGEDVYAEDGRALNLKEAHARLSRLGHNLPPESTLRGWLTGCVLMAPQALRRHASGEVSASANRYGIYTEAMRRLQSAGIAPVHATTLEVISRWAECRQVHGLALRTKATTAVTTITHTMHLANPGMPGFVVMRRDNAPQESHDVLLEILSDAGVPLRENELFARLERRGRECSYAWRPVRAQQMAERAQDLGLELVTSGFFFELRGVARAPEAQALIARRLEIAARVLQLLMAHRRSGTDWRNWTGDPLRAQEALIAEETLPAGELAAFWPEFPNNPPETLEGFGSLPALQVPGAPSAEELRLARGIDLIAHTSGREWMIARLPSGWIVRRRAFHSARRIHYAYYNRSRTLTEDELELGLEELCTHGSMGARAIDNMLQWAAGEGLRVRPATRERAMALLAEREARRAQARQSGAQPGRPEAPSPAGAPIEEGLEEQPDARPGPAEAAGPAAIVPAGDDLGGLDLRALMPSLPEPAHASREADAAPQPTAEVKFTAPGSGSPVRRRVRVG